MTRRDGKAALLLCAVLVLAACEGTPAAEELTAGPTPATMAMALFEREQTDADALPEYDTLDGLEIDPASTRYIASKEGKSYWVGVAHRDGVARPCLIAETNGVMAWPPGVGRPAMSVRRS